MADRLVLEYRRVSGDLSTGYLREERQGDGEPGVVTLEAFAHATFSKMFSRLSHHLAVNPEAVAVVRRTDRDDLVDVPLSEDETRLLREDPAEFIQQRTLPTVTVRVSDRGEKST